MSCRKQSILALALHATILLSRSVESQLLPCPPPIPELEQIVNTREKCSCFYALAASGFDIGDSSNFDKIFQDDSVQNFAQTGQYVGADGIAEYLSFVKGGDEDAFVFDFAQIGLPLFLDMTGTTNTECVAVTATRRRMPFNTKYTESNDEMCVDAVAGATLYYTLTGNKDAPIVIQKINIWIPDELISEAVAKLVNTTPTANFICDTIINTCRIGGSSDKKSTSKKNNRLFRKCLKKYNDLPPNETTGGLTYIDGDSKGCRVLHAYFALTNPDHCPHVTFRAEEDVNGLLKCSESKGAPLSDFFSTQEMDLFYSAATTLGLPESGIEIKEEACVI